MAKSSKATQGSKAKSRLAAPARAVSKKKLGKPAALPVRSAPKKAKAVRTRALESVAPITATSALLAHLRADQLGVQLVMGRARRDELFPTGDDRLGDGDEEGAFLGGPEWVMG